MLLSPTVSKLVFSFVPFCSAVNTLAKLIAPPAAPVVVVETLVAGLAKAIELLT